MTRRDRRVGLCSTVPVEVLFAAGREPVDLNNHFVNHRAPEEFLRQADVLGMPRNHCAWTRGLFGVTVASEFSAIVVVPQGDCSGNLAMARVLQQRGVEVLEFNFPVGLSDRATMLEEEIARLAFRLGVPMKRVNETFNKLRPVRELLARLDKMNWDEGVVPGSIARNFMLQATDMGGNPQSFRRRLELLVSEYENAPRASGPRIALFGVPAILSGVIEHLEAAGAQVVLCETESDFAMIPPAETIVEQYQHYAYPYGIERRLDRFLKHAAERRIDGVVVYSQAFCHHNLEMAKVETELADWPTLVLEGDLPQGISARDTIRLEGFIELVRPHRPRGRGRPPTGLLKPADGLAVGLDLGSRYAKVAVRRGDQCRTMVLDTVEFYQQFAQRQGEHLAVGLELLLKEMGFDEATDPARRVISTGYGRYLVQFDNAVAVPEIQAHAAGAALQIGPQPFLLVDLGGQDTKAIIVEDGRVQSFVMNDKCAAGSGRYVENMASLLGRPLEELTVHTGAPVDLTNVCATFGESEVVGHIVSGVSLERICAGVMKSVAERTAQLIARLGEQGKDLPIVLAGGLASGAALATFLAAATGALKVIQLDEPRLNGAYGCLALLDSGQIGGNLEDKAQG